MRRALFALVLCGCSAGQPRVSARAPRPCVPTPKSCDVIYRYPVVEESPVTSAQTSPESETPVSKAVGKFKLLELASGPAATTCARIAEKVSSALDLDEPDLLRAIREARAILTADDATPAVEREQAARNAFDDALERATHTLADHIALLVVEDVLAAPECADAAMNAVMYASTRDYAFKVPFSEYEAVFRRRARAPMASVVEPTSLRCARDAVDARRGRYLSILHGKI
jgi:hypothetical protein